MKDKLAKIKTTYDEDGNIDHQAYLSTQKAIYDRQINFAIRVDAITDEQFVLKPLQMGFLSSTALKDQQKFKDIKKIMTDYNKSILEKGGTATNGLHLKKVVMESMLKFMRLMMLAPDTGTKKVILDIAHHWFIRHLDPKSSKKSTTQLLTQIKQIIVSKQLLPIDLVNKQLIINRVNDELRPYRIKARTMYNEIDDPKLQLNHYNTHKLQFMTQPNKDNLNQKDRKKWIDNLKFPKIQSYVYAMEEPQAELKNEDDQQKQNLYTTQQQPKPDQDLAKQPPLLDEKGNPIIPQQTKQGGQQNADQGVDLDFGAPGEQPQPQQQQQIIEDKKKGNLDPLLKVFILERIRKQKTQQAICTKVRQKSMNKYNSNYDEDLLSGDHLRQWAKTRARIKTQVSRRNQSMRGAGTISRGKQEDETLSFIQNDVNRIKVQSTIGQYKKNITAVEAPPDKLNSEYGLSLFDRRRTKTEAAHKPFSSILFDHSKKAQESSALSEISDIKQKFSKYKIYTPMDTLIKGLAPPDKLYGDDEGKVAWPNSQLLSNPFIKVAKKKKKKKKK